MEIILLLFFSISIILCICNDISIIIALVFGYLLFFGYGIYHKKTYRQMAEFSLKGILTIKNILITFSLIGIVTATWRASGSIAYIVQYASSFCSPSIMLLLSFLLCSLISFLTGTSFGSAATIGVICMAMSENMGIPKIFTGGAILSGVFFGDRCSAVSTSALLVSELTHTNLYTNIKHMMRTAFVPFAASCFLYWIIGNNIHMDGSAEVAMINFHDYYQLSPYTLLPVGIVLVFSLLKINVKITLSCSSVCALIVSILVQKIPVDELWRICIFGFYPESEALSKVMSGGGLLSMMTVLIIVCISSSYSGMFEGTGFLNKIEKHVYNLGKKITPFGSTILVSIVSAAIACNQTLATMLTYQICRKANNDSQSFAIDLENSVIVIAGLIPWSIAGAVPLASVGAPSICMGTAFYLYFIPVWNFIYGILNVKKKKERFQ